MPSYQYAIDWIETRTRVWIPQLYGCIARPHPLNNSNAKEWALEPTAPDPAWRPS
jgi:hypothetical protein